MLENIFGRMRHSLRNFRSSCNANVTTIFAIATLPIFGAVGAAVDYSHVNSARTAMQAAVDATALMLSKDPTALASNQLNEKAARVFTGLYTRPEVKNIVVTPTYTTTGTDQLVVAATGTVKASFVSLIGISQVTIGATSTVKWGNAKLRVALALDNTGSMNDSGKITALKTATKNLLAQLKKTAGKDGDVYVSIVPFVKDVNLGPRNYTKSWIDWTDWDANNGTCSISGNTTKKTCEGKGSCSNAGYGSESTCETSGVCSISGYTTKSSCQNAGVCSKSQYTSETSCKNNGGKWTDGDWNKGTWTAATWKSANHNTWNGCVADRGTSTGPSSGNYDTNVTKPTKKNPETEFPAEQFSPCPQAVMGLNYEWPAMNTLVDNMTPGGNTNQGIGLALAWMSLNGGGPFTVPAMDKKYKYQQVIILLTDGMNTQNRWYSDQASIDAREKITCANIKAANITLYTVQVNTGGDPTSTLLRECASDADKFFLLTSANQMVSAFSKIGTQLSNLYIAK